MRKKLLCFVLAAAMVMNVTSCNMKKKAEVLKDKVKEQVKEQVEKVEKNQKFKEVDGKIEVYLPVHYIHQRSDDYADIARNEGTMDYDENGLLLEEDLHKEEGCEGDLDAWDYSNYYRYNADYRMVYMSDAREDARSSNPTVKQYSFYYNEDGVLESGKEEFVKTYDSYEEDEYDDDTEYQFEYDTDNGVLTGWDIGNKYYYYTYQYDDKGHITECSEDVTSDVDNGFNGKVAYQYDSEGRVIKQINTNYDWDEYEEEVQYDKDGYITSCDGIKVGDGIKIQYNEKHKPTKITYDDWELNYEYNEKNLIAKLNTGLMVGELVFQYDDNDNIVEVTSLSDKNYKLSIEYEKFYVDKEYFDYYLKCYYYAYSALPFDECFRYRITEINQDVLQGVTISEFCDLPFVGYEYKYVDNPLHPNSTKKTEETVE